MRHRGFEPRTTWLKVKCSTNWANIPRLNKPNAQNRNRTSDTRIFSPLLYQLSYLGINCGSRIWTYDLRVMSPTSFQTAPPRDDYWIKTTICCFTWFYSYQRKAMDGGGFEPPKQSAADLQSVPFGHSGIHPDISFTLTFFIIHHRAQ